LRTEQTEGAGQDAGHAGGLAGSSTLWLIARDAGGRSEPPREPLLVDDEGGGGRGGEALAVFGHEEEAEMYLGLWAPGDGWRAREIGAGELASVLRGPSWPGARRVALDPLPGALAGATGFNLLVGMDRDRFAQRLARVARRRG
jgi:hypothetical protein